MHLSDISFQRAHLPSERAFSQLLRFNILVQRRLEMLESGLALLLLCDLLLHHRNGLLLLRQLRSQLLLGCLGLHLASLSLSRRLFQRQLPASQLVLLAH